MMDEGYRAKSTLRHNRPLDWQQISGPVDNACWPQSHALALPPDMSFALMNLVSVTLEHPMQSDVSSLLQQSDAVAALLYPGEYRRPINAASLAKTDTYVLIARIAEKAVGMCVLFDRGDCSAELKRMIVDAESRGAGVGMALLKGAEAQAIKLGALTMLLEVGTRNTEAQQLYRRGGYKPCDPFPPYARTPISLFMTRRLSTAFPDN
jgi:putative acetyltransferase